MDSFIPHPTYSIFAAMLTEPTHLWMRDQPRQQVVGDPAARGRPRQYTVYADEPLVLPARPARLVVRAALRVRQDLTRLASPA